MRFLVFICFLFAFVSNANSQLPTKLKYDELIYSFDSTTVLIRKGSKNSVYDLKQNKYAIEPTKNTLINFPQSNNYAEIDVETKRLNIIALVAGSYYYLFGSVDSCYFGWTSPEEGQYFYNYNGEFFEQEINGELLSQIDYNIGWTKHEIIKCSDGNYIVNHYYDGEMVGGESHIDEKTGATVTDGFYVDIQLASGVYNSELENWIIEPKYKRCYQVNDYVFCLNEDYVKGELKGDIFTNDSYNYTYDIFQLLPNSANIILGSYTQVDNDLLSKILNVDALEICEDQTHCIIENDGKKGFVRFQLFEQNRTPEPFFVYQEILKPQADFIYFSEQHNKIGVVNLDSTERVVLYHYNDENLEVTGRASMAQRIGSDQQNMGYASLIPFEDEEKYILDGTRILRVVSNVDGVFLFEEEYEIRGQYPHFGVTLFDDSLLVLIDFAPELMSRMPLKSLQYPGEDSMEVGDYLVYFAEQPAVNKSGVYNLISGEWLIYPEYKMVRKSSKGYLAEKVNYNPQGLNSGFEFHIFNQNAELLQTGISAGELEKIPEYFGYLINSEYDIDSVYEAQIGAGQHRKNPDMNKYYYVEIGNDLSLYNPITAYNFNSRLMCEPQEFVHYNPDFNFHFWLEGDSIYVKLDSIVKSVSKQNGKIFFNGMSEVGYWFLSAYEITLIEGTDSVVVGNFPDEFGFMAVSASIEIKNGFLIVNDSSTKSFDDEGMTTYSVYTIESENSSVWKKSGDKWCKISPYYSQVIAIPEGFIAKSGYFYSDIIHHDIEGADRQQRVEIQPRYFFLDSNCNVVPYMDWFDFPLIEDLGFGLKVCYDNSGCFFMTYKRVAVTDAEWDDFELFNKKLKAIKNEVPMIDEYGEQFYDENGVPVMASESVIMFFKIP